MYDKSDPRSALAKASEGQPPPKQFFGAEYGLFYSTEPQISTPDAKTWVSRGQNFVVAYTEGEAGATLERREQSDEYAIILPDKDSEIEITTTEGTQVVPGYSVAFIPPGPSTIKLLRKTNIVRLLTPAAKDLADLAANTDAFRGTHPTVPPFVAWPAPAGGLKLKWYSLDVPQEPGRFGRIFRCTTFMINYLEPRNGPRDRKQVSPHHHDDFEQCSLAVSGTFTHHIRWPWTTDMTIWRDDEHGFCESPSICVIPPPAIHTTTAEGPGVNQLVDIFAPPRMDFSAKPGWVLNEADYPMPSDR
ncbi:MAG TPA: hypothetical protein VL147_08985 [Devosia sp.]|nr:hypothetical protein [Devosia sp.]